MAEKGCEEAAALQMGSAGSGGRLAPPGPGMGGCWGERGAWFPWRGQSLPKYDGGGVAEATGHWAWRDMTFPVQLVIKEGPEEPEAG